MDIWVRKNFFRYSPPTIMGSRSTIQVVDYGSMLSRIRIFQKCTKRLIGTLKRLFGPQKNFPTMDAGLINMISNNSWSKIRYRQPRYLCEAHCKARKRKYNKKHEKSSKIWIYFFKKNDSVTCMRLLSFPFPTSFY